MVSNLTATENNKKGAEAPVSERASLTSTNGTLSGVELADLSNGYNSGSRTNGGGSSAGTPETRKSREQAENRKGKINDFTFALLELSRLSNNHIQSASKYLEHNKKTTALAATINAKSKLLQTEHSTVARQIQNDDSATKAQKQKAASLDGRFTELCISQDECFAVIKEHLDEFNDLQTELKNPDTTEERKLEISFRLDQISTVMNKENKQFINISEDMLSTTSDLIKLAEDLNENKAPDKKIDLKRLETLEKAITQSLEKFEKDVDNGAPYLAEARAHFKELKEELGTLAPEKLELIEQASRKADEAAMSYAENQITINLEKEKTAKEIANQIKEHEIEKTEIEAKVTELEQQHNELQQQQEALEKIIKEAELAEEFFADNAGKSRSKMLHGGLMGQILFHSGNAVKMGVGIETHSIEDHVTHNGNLVFLRNNEYVAFPDPSKKPGEEPYVITDPIEKLQAKIDSTKKFLGDDTPLGDKYKKGLGLFDSFGGGQKNDNALADIKEEINALKAKTTEAKQDLVRIQTDLKVEQNQLQEQEDNLRALQDEIEQRATANEALIATFDPKTYKSFVGAFESAASTASNIAKAVISTSPLTAISHCFTCAAEHTQATPEPSIAPTNETTSNETPGGQNTHEPNENFKAGLSQ